MPTPNPDLLDLRRTISEINRLRDLGEPIPPSLAPSMERMRAVIQAIRRDRGLAEEASPPSAAPGKINNEMGMEGLLDLFNTGEKK